MAQKGPGLVKPRKTPTPQARFAEKLVKKDEEIQSLSESLKRSKAETEKAKLNIRILEQKIK
jgi:hypothetical protein